MEKYLHCPVNVSDFPSSRLEFLYPFLVVFVLVNVGHLLGRYELGLK